MRGSAPCLRRPPAMPFRTLIGEACRPTTPWSVSWVRSAVASEWSVFSLTGSRHSGWSWQGFGTLPRTRLRPPALSRHGSVYATLGRRSDSCLKPDATANESVKDCLRYHDSQCEVSNTVANSAALREFTIHRRAGVGNSGARQGQEDCVIEQSGFRNVVLGINVSETDHFQKKHCTYK